MFDLREQNPYSEHPIVAQPRLTDYAEVSGPCDFNSLQPILPSYQIRNVDTIRGIGASAEIGVWFQGCPRWKLTLVRIFPDCP